MADCELQQQNKFAFFSPYFRKKKNSLFFSITNDCNLFQIYSVQQYELHNFIFLHWECCKQLGQLLSQIHKLLFHLLIYEIRNKFYPS